MIIDFLDSLSLKQQYSDLVKNEVITGELLSVVENIDDLKELGIESTIHAKLLLKKIMQRKSVSQLVSGSNNKTCINYFNYLCRNSL